MTSQTTTSNPPRGLLYSFLGGIVSLALYRAYQKKYEKNKLKNLTIPKPSVIIWDENKPNTPKITAIKMNDIVSLLNKRGVRYEKWDASQELSDNSTSEEVLKAYASDISRIKKEFGFKTEDVIQLTPDHPKKAELRCKFLSEHTHNEEEVRFFVEGGAAFYLHINNEVIRIVCTKGHLLVVPTGTKHWFDMGHFPFFKVIRFFGTKDGWIAKYSGDKISNNFIEFVN